MSKQSKYQVVTQTPAGERRTNLSVAVSRDRVSHWLDALIASDPGLTRLLQALQVTAGIGVTIAVEYGFAQLVHPFWDSAPAGVHLSAVSTLGLAAQHHALTLIAMLLGGIVGMISSIAVTDVTRRGQAISMIGLPVPFLAMVAASIELAPHRAIALVGLSLVMGLGTYGQKFVPRFGPRMVMYGILLFIGYFFGFTAHKELPIGQIYWVAALLWLAVAVNFALRVIVFNPLAAGTLQRSRRSFSARARGVIAETAAVFQETRPGQAGPTRHARRLARRLVRLNEAAVTIDGQLADPRQALAPGAAQSLHRSLFELELQLGNLARAVGVLAQPNSQLDPQLRARVATWLADLGRGDCSDAATYEREDANDEPVGSALRTSNVVFATAASVVAIDESLKRWQQNDPTFADASDAVDFAVAYQTPVALLGSNLTGSSQASRATVAAETAHGLAARLHLDGAAVAALRMTIAVGAACAIASAVNEQRFYWAVLAIFMIYMGTNTAGEQITKAFHRVFGTLIGIVIGTLLAHALGPSTWTIAVILPAGAIAIYFMPIVYAIMAAGVTVMLSMLYVDLGEFSNGLLVDRLELTAIGAAIAILAALLIFPNRTGRVLRQAALQYLDALHALVEGLSETMPTPPGGELAATSSTSTIAARHLDDTLHQLLATARPLTRDPFRRDALENNLQTFVAGARFARDLAAGAGAGAVTALARSEHDQLATALDTEANLVRDVRETVRRHDTGPDMQTATSAIDPIITASRDLAGHGVVRSDPQQQFLRALANLDGTLIQLSRQLTDA